jgi:hypothetical protein
LSGSSWELPSLAAKALTVESVIPGITQAS